MNKYEISLIIFAAIVLIGFIASGFIVFGLPGALIAYLVIK